MAKQVGPVWVAPQMTVTAIQAGCDAVGCENWRESQPVLGDDTTDASAMVALAADRHLREVHGG